MKKQILILWAMLLISLGAVAQTDVTSQYLTNADFDDSSSWQTGNITTGQNANSLNVEGWTLASSAAWSSSAAFGFGTSGQINGVTIPSTDSNGNTGGGALGISTGWGGVCQYTQDVTFTAGKYRISYAAYNGLSGKTQSNNYIGFIPNSGTAIYGAITNFTYGEWVTGEVVILLTQPTSGKVSVGLGAVSGGSGDNAKVFIDYVKIEAYNPTEVVNSECGSYISNTSASWTNPSNATNSGSATCNGVTMLERWFNSIPTGDITSYTANLPNGIYETSVYCHGHVAWVTSPVTSSGATGYTTLSANGVTADIPVILNTG
ncbi:MAG: hypothetical protein IK084_02220 [Bacteroidaceae bacterium]|nr:hypothetical protein [Bacteroidaceae bacterium]